MRNVLRTRHGAVAAALFALALGLVGTTLDDPGVTWDEPGYYISAQLQVRWVGKLLSEGPAAALDPEVIRETWDWDHYHNPHPPIYKEGMALTWWAAQGLLGPLAAYRLFPAILFATVVAVAWLWGAAAWGPAAGLGASLSILLMPRLFGHAHLGATETPLLAWWFLGTAAVWWAVARDRRIGWPLAGAAWGLAAGAKFTGVVALAPAIAWAAWRDRRVALSGAPIAAATAVAVFAALNPLVWADPVGFFETWLWESTHRGDYAPIATRYLGETYPFDVPWHHVFVMTVAVTPLGILALAGIGAWAGLRRRDPLAVLAAGGVIFVWAVMLAPGAPHHNGVRQFVPVFPFLGLLAGLGLEAARRAAGSRAALLAATLAFVPPVVDLVRYRPYWLSYYGEAVGGLAGAHARGLERTYWMDVVSDELYRWMDRTLPEGARVTVLGTTGTVELAQALGRVRRDLEFTDTPPADYYVVPMIDILIGPSLERAVREVRPLFEARRDGVPLVAVYRLEGGGP